MVISTFLLRRTFFFLRTGLASNLARPPMSPAPWHNRMSPARSSGFGRSAPGPRHVRCRSGPPTALTDAVAQLAAVRPGIGSSPAG